MEVLAWNTLEHAVIHHREFAQSKVVSGRPFPTIVKCSSIVQNTNLKLPNMVDYGVEHVLQRQKVQMNPCRVGAHPAIPVSALEPAPVLPFLSTTNDTINSQRYMFYFFYYFLKQKKLSSFSSCARAFASLC
jgi:hypothetical protein